MQVGIYLKFFMPSIITHFSFMGKCYIWQLKCAIEVLFIKIESVKLKMIENLVNNILICLKQLNL